VFVVPPPSRPEARRSVPSRVRELGGERGAFALLALTVMALAAPVALIGADARWLAALGRIIAERGAVPAGVPFAAAASAHWHNPIVLAELVFHWLDSGLGDRGLMLAQLLAVAVAVAALYHDSRAAGATRQATAAAVLLGSVGAISALAVIRVQLFSLALFPLAAALLRREARAPTRRIWLIVPLLVLWANLHGAALTGLGMTLAYLALSRARARPLQSAGVAIAAALALCLTPAGIHTIAYYDGVLANRAAVRGQGLWAPLSLTAPLDLVLLVSVLGLGARLRRRGPPLWELAVLLGLGAITVKAGRSGVWLIFFLIPMAAPAFRTRRVWDRLLPALGTAAACLLVIAVVRGPLPSGAPGSLVRRAIALSRARPILADDLFAEQVALAGGRIVIGNPIDAFSPREQNIYLDWLAGARAGLQAIGPSVVAVITGPTGGARAVMSDDADFRMISATPRADLFVRRHAGPTAGSVPGFPDPSPGRPAGLG
jgi:hypothetical protein